MPSTGSNSTLSAIEMSKKAEKIGVDGLMLVVPYYNKPPKKVSTSILKILPLQFHYR